MNTIDRRQVAKGIAWSAPTIALISAAPAMAASNCQTAVRGSFGNTYDFGTIYDYSGYTTTQVLRLGGQTYVDNLPPNVTVTSITYDFWFERRPDRATGPGAFPVNSSYTGKTGTSWNDFVPTAGSGFSRTVRTTSSDSAQVFPDGVSRRAWNLQMTWSAQADTLNQYSSTPSGCRNFTTGPSSKYPITYTRVPALTTADVQAGKKSVTSFATVTATLSNGEVLTKSYQAVLTR